MVWIFTYAFPATLLFLTSKYVGRHNWLYTHLLLLISTGLSWIFIETFFWGFDQIKIILLILVIALSWVFLKQIKYTISAIIQEMTILSAVAISPMWALPFIVGLFSITHPTTPLKIATVFLGIASIFLYFQFQTVTYSIILHIIGISTLFYFRKGVMLS